MSSPDNTEDGETTDRAARRAAILDAAEDPPDYRPELLAGSLHGSGIFIHETGKPGEWIRMDNPVEAPDFEVDDDGR